MFGKASEAEEPSASPLEERRTVPTTLHFHIFPLRLTKRGKADLVVFCHCLSSPWLREKRGALGSVAVELKRQGATFPRFHPGKSPGLQTSTPKTCAVC